MQNKSTPSADEAPAMTASTHDTEQQSTSDELAELARAHAENSADASPSETNHISPDSMTDTEATKPKAAKPEKESLLANLLLNIVIPTLILTKLSGDEYLGTKYSIVVALAFPIIYGIKDFVRAHKVNFFSALGVISIVLTGGMSLLELPPEYIAIKEAAIPGLLGLATLFSLKTKMPLVRTFLYNDKFLKVDIVNDALTQRQQQTAFDSVMTNASFMIAGSFFLSSALNYILAKMLLVSPPGSVAFNEELGKMTALSFPVIAVPATLIMMGTLFYVFRTITKLTGLSLEDIINEQ